MKRKVWPISTLLLAATLLTWPAFPQSQAESPDVVRLRYATVVVPDYDEALRWYTGVLGLEKVEEGSCSVQAPRTARDFECSSRNEPERTCGADIGPEEPFELHLVGNVEEDFRFRLWHLSAL